MNPQITALHELQNRDRQLSRLERKLELIPRRIKELDDDLAKLEGMLTAERRKCEETRSFQRSQEMQLAEEEDLVRHSKARISQVKTARELNATQREMESTRRMASARTEEIVKIKAGVQEAEQRIEAMSRSLDELRVAAAEEKTRLESARDTTAAKLAKLRERRGTLTDKIEREILATYERIRRRLAGVAFAAARENRCSACKMVVPAQIYVALRKGDEILDCESCGRLLYWAGHFPEEMKAADEPADGKKPEKAPKAAPTKRAKTEKALP
jgi:predicted  nucleic acid-binding Zn-ribbon protein